MSKKTSGVYESSRLGELLTVAERSTIKPILIGLLWLPFALGLGGLSVFFLAMASRGSTGDEIERYLPYAGVAFGLAAFFLLTTVIRRFRAAVDKRLYVRAGPGGVALCIPGDLSWKALTFTYKLEIRELLWSEINTYYAYKHTINFLPSELSVVFLMQAGWKLEVHSMYFKGSRDTMVSSLSEASHKKDLAGPSPASG